MARAPALQEIEATPEADRLEGFPHPRETKALLGHDVPQAGFAQAFSEARVHHGWLLTGREGIGKATLAYRIARYVLAKPEERELFEAKFRDIAEAYDVLTDADKRQRCVWDSLSRACAQLARWAVVTAYPW